jgi:ubiquinol-cytochrome c reductase cytochrome b subunit
MNKLGAAGHPVPGSFFLPDPEEETAALERARERQHRAILEADAARNGDGGEPASSSAASASLAEGGSRSIDSAE